MFAISNSPSFGSLVPAEKLFLESWFNLTHPRSLDSYRVRCLNGRTILEELKREIELKIANAEDFGVILNEAKLLCEGDAIVQKMLGGNYAILHDLLGKLPGKYDSKEALFASKEWARLGFVLEDVLPILDKGYVNDGFVLLTDAIAANSPQSILGLTGLLATDLAQRGWSLASLHAWIETIFLTGRVNFSTAYQQFVDRLRHPPEDFEIVLNLSGSKDLQTLGDFCGFRFSADAPVVSEGVIRTSSLEKFLRTNAHRSFATTTVAAVDQLSAGHAGLEKFGFCQDRLRYNLCPLPLSVGRHVLVTRLSDRKQKLVPLVFGVPNPEHIVPLNAFLAANRSLDQLLVQGRVDDTSRMRIQAAARHYRLGRDGRAYHDMLLSWWMGLETLTSPGEGKGIGMRVFANAGPLLCHRYLVHQLRHLGDAVKTACSRWPATVATFLGVSEEHDLTWQQVLTVLQDTGASVAVSGELANHPWLEHQWKRFQTILSNPAQTRDYLRSHAERVRWHLMRLYRIRCCLVHGTPVLIPLQLPAANLEYYLREALFLVTSVLERAPHLRSVETVFSRTAYAAERREIVLSAKGATAAVIRDVVESGLTFDGS